MAEVLLFHHAQGKTAGIEAFADELRRAGHTVHAPDLYDGRTFATVDEGVAYAGDRLRRGHRARRACCRRAARRARLRRLLARGDAGAEAGPDPPGARGALLFHACASVSEFGTSWPADVPVQVHAMDADPFFVDEGDIDAARELVESAERAELFLYPGREHLFADSSLPSYDADAAALLRRRVLDFLQTALPTLRLILTRRRSRRVSAARRESRYASRGRR